MYIIELNKKQKLLGYKLTYFINYRKLIKKIYLYITLIKLINIQNVLTYDKTLC